VVDWLEISVTVGPDAVPAVVDLFDQHVSGGTVIETPVDCFEYDLPAMTPADQVVVKGYLPLDSSANDSRYNLERGLWLLQLLYSTSEPVVRPVADDEWTEAWRKQFRLQRIGSSIVIVPDWETYEPAPDEAVIRLEPGMAFGTGLHPTTRLCLVALETHLHPGCRVLDVGTGSGVLAIAAARLGADSVLALDADPVAALVAQENVARNGVADLVIVQHGSLPGGMLQGKVPGHFTAGGPVSLLDSGHYDLVLVNILAPVIVAMAPALAARLAAPTSGQIQGAGTPAPSGSMAKLIVAGLIESQVAEVVDAFRAQGLQAIERAQEEDWVCLVASRR
jgi:ribosomal protein L11 methyltransferase